MFWAILFLTGVRFGEAAARRWRHYQPAAQPLGRIVVNTSWNSELKKEKETKTKQPRDVPVHPLLAEILVDWRANGWPRVMGRSPSDDDLIVPFGDSDDRVRSNRWKGRPAGLLRPTHRRPNDVDPLCEEVLKLKVQRRRIPDRIAAVANAAEFLGVVGPEVTPRVTPPLDGSEFLGDHAVMASMLVGARRGTRTPTFFGHGNLNPARLPVPPSSRGEGDFTPAGGMVASSASA